MREILGGKERGQVQDKLLWHRALQLREGEGGQSSNWAGWNKRFVVVQISPQSQHSSDDVRAEFCSDVDSVCCRTKLSTLLHDDWSKNDDEQWGESNLGACKTTLYKVGFDCDLNDQMSLFPCMTTYCQRQVRDGIRFTLLKNGKRNLAREQFHLHFLQERTTCR